MSYNLRTVPVLSHAYALALLVAALVMNADAEYGRTLSVPTISFGNVRVSGGLLIETAVLIPVSVLVAALLIPPAFAQVFGATTAGWNSAVITIFQILFPALAVLAIAFQYVRELTRGV